MLIFISTYPALPTSLDVDFYLYPYLDVDLYLNLQLSSTTHLYRAHSLRSLWPHYLATQAQPALKCSFVPLPALANLKKNANPKQPRKCFVQLNLFPLLTNLKEKLTHTQTSSEAKMHLCNFCSKEWLSCRCWPIKKFYLYFLYFQLLERLHFNNVLSWYILNHVIFSFTRPNIVIKAVI